MAAFLRMFIRRHRMLAIAKNATGKFNSPPAVPD